MRAVSAEDYESVIRENEELRAQVGLLERQFEVSKGHEPNMEDVQKMGKKLLKKYKSSYSIEDFRNTIGRKWSIVQPKQTKYKCRDFFKFFFRRN